MHVCKKEMFVCRLYECRKNNEKVILLCLWFNSIHGVDLNKVLILKFISMIVKLVLFLLSFHGHSLLHRQFPQLQIPTSTRKFTIITQTIHEVFQG